MRRTRCSSTRAAPAARARPGRGSSACRRVRVRLEEAEADERRPRPGAAAAARASAGRTSPAGRGSVNGTSLEPEARDLLDEVDLARDVARAPGRRRDVAVAATLEAEALEDRAARRSAISRPISCVRALGPEADRRGRSGSSPCTSVVAGPARAGELDEQLRSRGRRPARRGTGRRPSPSGSSPPCAGAGARRCARSPSGSKFAASSSTVVVAVGDLRLLAAHDPGERDRRARRRRSRGPRGVELALAAVERADLLARPRAADDDPALGERVEVERVERVAEREHDVVRHVDDVRDRPHPGAEQARLQPARRRRRPRRRGTAARRSAGSPRGRRSRMSTGSSPARVRVRPRAAARAARRRAPPPRARCRRSTRGRAGCRVVSTRAPSSTSGSTSASGVPGSRVVEQHDPAVVGAELDLVLGEDHPVGDLAAELARARAAARSAATAPGSATRDRGAGAEVPGAADDLAGLGLADVDAAELQPVGVRVLLGLEHPPDAEAGRGCRPSSATPRRLEPLDLAARERRAASASSSSGSVERRRTRAASETGTLHQNCPSTRRSFSQSGADVRRCRGGACAIRSSPKPKANPDHSSGS